MFGVTKNKAIVVTILVLSIVSEQPVTSLGKRSFGESCSFVGHFTSFFSPEREERTCDSNMGLICTGTCLCPPGRVWDTNANFLSSSSDGPTRGCVRAVGSTCFSSDQCVSNAHCSFAFCRCKPDFKRNGGHCVSTSSSTNSEDASPPQTRPATASGITFPELQEIFAGFNSEYNSQQANNFNNNKNDDGNYNNDRFHPINSYEHDHFNDRFHGVAENSNFNDRFQENINDRYHDPQNTRDGSRGSSSAIRFEE